MPPTGQRAASPRFPSARRHRERCVVEGNADVEVVTTPSFTDDGATESALVRDELLEEGLYRYLPLQHVLLFIESPENLAERLNAAVVGQRFVSQAPVTFIWSVVPYRTEWRYHSRLHKVIALDAGHLCQNLGTVIKNFSLPNSLEL